MCSRFLYSKYYKDYELVVSQRGTASNQVSLEDIHFGERLTWTDHQMCSAGDISIGRIANTWKRGNHCGNNFNAFIVVWFHDIAYETDCVLLRHNSNIRLPHQCSTHTSTCTYIHVHAMRHNRIKAIIQTTTPEVGKSTTRGKKSHGAPWCLAS
jgi:hypothetical protein